MLLLVLSLFFTEPMPLDMPRAEAYAVQDDKVMRLEDRYDKSDLWLSRAVIGRWMDDDGRVFMLSALDVEPPANDFGKTLTRVDYTAQCVEMPRVRANHDLPIAFRQAISCLSPCEISETPRHSRQLPRGYRDVDYWQEQTNFTALVCSFRKEKSERWYLATWQLAEGDDIVERIKTFEEKFLGGEFDALLARFAPANDAKPLTKVGEREQLRSDARHSVVAYDEWKCVDSEEFSVLYGFSSRTFIDRLTNEFATMRARYTAAIPTPIDGSNVLAVARIYANRDEYLDSLEVNDREGLEWSAAYWSQRRRELVAYLPNNGEDELLKTFRHEAFHQYLSYAASMIQVSPWMNEGYAEYFEDSESDDWGESIEVTKESLVEYAKILPALLMMNYDDFYSGSDFRRRLKYRLAWSIAYFIENGAPKVRFEPFKDIKRRYINVLLKTGDMKKATSAAFENEDKLKLFIEEWRKFWTER